MTELEKIAYAKSFIDKLAQGINPIDDTPVPEDDIVNNVRLSRCFFYVSDILRQVIDNGGVALKKSKKKLIPFHLTDEKLMMFDYSPFPIALSVIADKLNALIDNKEMQEIRYKDLSQWLISINALKNETLPDGTVSKMPTETGTLIGIDVQHRQGQYKEYSVVVYNREAQKFIIDNLDAIIALKYSK